MDRNELFNPLKSVLAKPWMIFIKVPGLMAVGPHQVGVQSEFPSIHSSKIDRASHSLLGKSSVDGWIKIDQNGWCVQTMHPWLAIVIRRSRKGGEPGQLATRTSSTKLHCLHGLNYHPVTSGWVLSIWVDPLNGHSPHPHPHSHASDIHWNIHRTVIAGDWVSWMTFIHKHVSSSSIFPYPWWDMGPLETGTHIFIEGASTRPTDYIHGRSTLCIVDDMHRRARSVLRIQRSSTWRIVA